MFDYRLEHIYSCALKLQAPPEVIGPVAEGLRANFYFAGGQVSGPRLTATVRPVGGDWITIRTDGVGILDIRATLESRDGALIAVAAPGIADLGEDGYEKFLRQAPPPIVPLRLTPRNQTAHPDYRWLNRLCCVGIGQADLQRFEVSFDVYALR